MFGFPLFTLLVFVSMIGGLLGVDYVMNHGDKKQELNVAIKWSVLYVLAASVFATFVLLVHGTESASLFVIGYTLEKILAFDNLFVFALIFTYFNIPDEKQHDALHWGIGGAILFRLIFVIIGVSSLWLFGTFMELIFAAIIGMSIYAILKSDDVPTDFDNVWYVKKIKKFYPGITPFILSIIVIEISDIMFSFDSIPAILAVTKVPWIVFSSMIFAIVGLRQMYFVLSALRDKLAFMDDAVIVILSFIAGKLVVSALFNIHINPLLSLVIIASIICYFAMGGKLRGVAHGH